MAKSRFKKGEPVTLISSWDGKGTFWARNYIVHSCGAVRLYLICAESGMPASTWIDPQAPHVFPGMSAQDAEAKALELAGNFIDECKANIEATLARPGIESWLRERCLTNLSELHEPRAHLGRR